MQHCHQPGRSFLHTQSFGIGIKVFSPGPKKNLDNFDVHQWKRLYICLKIFTRSEPLTSVVCCSLKKIANFGLKSVVCCSLKYNMGKVAKLQKFALRGHQF